MRAIGLRAVQVLGREWPSARALLSDVARPELEAIAARVQGVGIPAAGYSA